MVRCSGWAGGWKEDAIWSWWGVGMRTARGGECRAECSSKEFPTAYLCAQPAQAGCKGLHPFRADPLVRSFGYLTLQRQVSLTCLAHWQPLSL